MKKQNTNKDFHYLRYGIAAEQKFIKEFINSFSYLIINANIVAQTREALYRFLNNISRKVKFIIDPQTHAFQHDHSFLESAAMKKIGKKVLKRSITKIVEEYGSPLNEVLNTKKRILLPEDFNSENIIKSFCKNVIDFQTNTIKNQESKSDVAEYYDFLRKKGKIDDSSMKPAFVIAPYFYLSDVDHERWLDLNIKFIKISNTLLKKSDPKLAAELVFSKEILNDRNKLDKIINEYNSINVNTIFLWIDSFSEHSADDISLKMYIKLLKSLKKPIVNLYGGYFSIILGLSRKINNLVGITHGVGYSEERSVIPVGGGVPTAKFYLPKLHKRLIFRNALIAIRELQRGNSKNDYLKNICNCNLCEQIIGNNPLVSFENYGKTKPGKDFREYPTSETMDNCTRHYMYCKHREYAGTIDIEEIIKNLSEIYEDLRKRLPTDEIGHCKKWSDVLKNEFNSQE